MPIGKQKSTSALRGQQWREKQKQNPKFNQDEAHRKREERKQRMLAGWLREYPIDQKSNELGQNNLGRVFLTKAPKGKGRAESGGYRGAEIEQIAGLRTADAEMSELPLRAQLSDEELQQKLADAAIDVQSRIDLILEHWKHDKKFCIWGNQLSLDE